MRRGDRREDHTLLKVGAAAGGVWLLLHFLHFGKGWGIGDQGGAAAHGTGFDGDGWRNVTQDGPKPNVRVIYLLCSSQTPMGHVAVTEGPFGKVLQTLTVEQAAVLIGELHGEIGRLGGELRVAITYTGGTARANVEEVREMARKTGLEVMTVQQKGNP